jgi:hypothetical protein
MTRHSHFKHARDMASCVIGGLGRCLSSAYCIIKRRLKCALRQLISFLGLSLALTVIMFCMLLVLFQCCGAPLSISSCHCARGGDASELGFLCKINFDGLPLEAWEPEALNHLINNLCGEIVEIVPPDYR